MSIKGTTLAEEGTPAHITRCDGVRVLAADYQPVWVASLADDVTLEGSAMNGVVQGAEAVRSIVTCIRALYESPGVQLRRPLRRERLPGGLHGPGPRGRADRQRRPDHPQRRRAAQHIVANYRPRTTLLHLSRLIGEQLADTPYGEHFATSAPE